MYGKSWLLWGSATLKGKTLELCKILAVCYILKVMYFYKLSVVIVHQCIILFWSCRWWWQTLHCELGRCVSFSYTILQTGTEVFRSAGAQRLLIGSKPKLRWHLHRTRSIQVCALSNLSCADHVISFLIVLFLLLFHSDINVCSIKINEIAKKLKYGMITRWGEYEWQCDMEVIYSAYKFEQWKKKTEVRWLTSFKRFICEWEGTLYSHLSWASGEILE